MSALLHPKTINGRSPTTMFAHITGMQKTKKNIFEPLPSQSLSRLPTPFYKLDAYDCPINFSEISESSDSFSKELESIIEKVMSESNCASSSCETSVKSEKMPNDKKNSVELKLMNDFLSQSISESKDEAESNGQFNSTNAIGSVIDKKNIPETTPEEYLSIDGQEYASQQVTKRKLKGDWTGEPVSEVAVDNNTNIQQNARGVIMMKLVKSYIKMQNFIDRYPIYTAGDIMRQKAALVHFKKKIDNEKVREGSHMAKQCCYTILLGPYYLGKMLYKQFLKSLIKYSIEHLEEFKDTDYQEVLNFAKIQTVNIDSSSKSSMLYRQWMQTANEVALTPVSSYRKLGTNTSSLLPSIEG